MKISLCWQRKASDKLSWSRGDDVSFTRRRSWVRFPPRVLFALLLRQTVHVLYSMYTRVFSELKCLKQFVLAMI